MALHGEIKVNGHIIGYWEANRTDTELREGCFRYKCRVTVHEAHHEPEDINFDLWHRFEDGALVLAALVLSHALLFRERDKEIEDANVV